MTDLNATIQRLIEAKKQELFRQTQAEITRRAVYELVREIAGEAAHFTLAAVAQTLLTDDEVGKKLTDALRERHAVADPLASEIVETVRSVLSALVAEIALVDDRGELPKGSLVP